MLAFLIRRLSVGFLTLLIITFVVYGLIRAMPGTPITQDEAKLDPKNQISPEDYQRMLKDYGLDKPWYQAYWSWAGNLLKGDLGRSYVRKRPVTSVIGERVGNTLFLGVTSIGLAYLLSIPLGLLWTARAGKLDERIGGIVLYALYSFPTFVAALFLQMFVGGRWELLPQFGMQSDNYDQLSSTGKLLDLLKHSILPITVSTYGSLAYYSRFIRANLQEVIRQDFIRTAQAKGLGPYAVVVKHAFRNTLIPLVTKLGLTLPALLSGSVIVERIFNWPGMGELFFKTILERDYPVIMGLTLVFSVLTLAGQLLADVLYAIVDPRVRIEDAE